MNQITFKNWLAPIVATIIFLIVWQVFSSAWDTSGIVVASPIAVFSVLFSQAAYLTHHGLITLGEASAGFAIGSAIGIGLAVLFVFSGVAERALYPYAIIVKAIPLVALAPIIVSFFGGDIASKVVMAAIISFFPVLVSAADGFRGVDHDAVDLMRSFSATRWDIFRLLQWPQALPQIFAGLKISSSFAVVGAVVAEFVNADVGIGSIIRKSSYYLETDINFAAIFVAAIAGLFLFAVVSVVGRKVVFWQKPFDSQKQKPFNP